MWFKSNHPYIFISLFVILGWLFFQGHCGCLVIPMLRRRLINCRQRPNMTIAVEWDAKQQIKIFSRTSGPILMALEM